MTPYTFDSDVPPLNTRCGASSASANRRPSSQQTQKSFSTITLDAAMRAAVCVASLQTKLDGLLKEKRELVIRAPAAGIILELDPQLHPGRWIAKADRLALIAARERHIVRGYLSGSSLLRLKTQAVGRFIPRRPDTVCDLRQVAQCGARGSHLD